MPATYVARSACCCCCCLRLKCCHIVYLLNLRFFRPLLCYTPPPWPICCLPFGARLLCVCVHTTCSPPVQHLGACSFCFRCCCCCCQPVAAFDLLPLIYLCAARHNQYFIFGFAPLQPPLFSLALTQSHKERAKSLGVTRNPTLWPTRFRPDYATRPGAKSYDCVTFPNQSNV